MDKETQKESLSAWMKDRQQWAVGIVVGITLLCLFGFYVFTRSTVAPAVPAKKQKTEFSDPISHGSETLWRENQEEHIAETKTSMQSMQSTIAALKAQQAAQAELIKSQTQRMRSLESQILAQANNTAPAAGQPYPGSDQYGSQYGSAGAAPARKHIAVTTFALTPAPNASAVYTTKNYVPAGSFVRAVLLSGLDAPTGVDNQAKSGLCRKIFTAREKSKGIFALDTTILLTHKTAQKYFVRLHSCAGLF